LPLAAWSVYYGLNEKDEPRLNALILSNGKVSMVQQESWFDSSKSIQPGDRILRMGGHPYSLASKKWLQTQKPGSKVSLEVQRGDHQVKASIEVREYNRSSLLFLWVLPLFLSLALILLATLVLTPE